MSQNAGEMISFFTLAMHAGVGAKKVSDVIAPYPTVAEVMKYVFLVKHLLPTPEVFAVPPPLSY